MAKRLWVPATLILILAAAALFRFTGINWDQNQHQQPDERFVTMVAERIRPVASLSEYWDTENSSLNPLDYGFYTYGMWPLFLTRYVGEWVGKTKYDEIVLVGRVLSGLFDLACVLAVYLLGARLYSRRAGLLAAGLYAAAVVPIQLAHFFAVDSFTTLFTIAAFYAAVLVMERARWWAFVLFGIFTGIAVAGKVSMAPLAGLVVVAGVAYALKGRPDGEELKSRLLEVAGGWLLAAVCTVWFFRLLQPYAFMGPGLFGLRLNPRWLQIVREVSDQVAGRSDFPPNHHWAGRPFSYGWTNLVLWGMGLPLGLTATAAWGWAAWRTWKGDWQRHLLLVLWVGAFFLWQSTNFWRYTRYYLPIYPFAILLAAWALLELVRRTRAGWRTTPRATIAAGLAALLLVGVVVSTYAYAYAFSRIYTRPHTRVAASRWMFQQLPGPVNVVLETAKGTQQLPLAMPGEKVLQPGEPWTVTFSPPLTGTITAVTAPKVSLVQGGDPAVTMEVALARGDAEGQPLALTSANLQFAADATGSQAFRFDLDPVTVAADEEAMLTLKVVEGGPLALAGTAIAVESTWDDSLPLGVDGYAPYPGLYQPLDLELHEADTEAKRQRMLEVLDQADYVAIASNRSYDAMPRLPLRFPLTTAFYRALFGCDAERLTDCAYPAVAPMKGYLGFNLVATFESYPNLGPLSFPDQSAQESFTVYDHPKVLLFAKSADYSSERAQAILEAVDLDNVVAQTAMQVSQAPNGLRLPAERLAAQEEAGTWTDLFAPTSPLNRSQTLAVLAWLLILLLSGWIAFPLTFAAFSGLSDRGYALARMVGLLLFAWLAWMAASYRIAPFSAVTLWLSLGLVALVSGFLAWRHRASLGAFLRARWRYILFVEGLFVVLFLFGLLLRWNNPDLWHPWRGGEKPGDLAMFSAVLKSAYFPPYDPWFSGNYVNYYYFGYVLAAVPTKLLGIAPAVAYNLLIPTWFALTGLGAFAVAYNLVAGRPSSEPDERSGAPGSQAPYLAGLAALVLMVILGNLYEFQLLSQRLLTTGVDLEGLSAGPWYFDASRAILNGQPAAPITEFPFFTFLYADLHPHLLDMPIVLAGLAWLLSFTFGPVLLSRANIRQRPATSLATWLVGGLLLGATYPTNTWDFPVLAGLGAVVVGYATWMEAQGDTRTRIERLILHVALLLALSVLLFAPFRQWFGTGAQSVQRWRGPRTPLSDYLTVHGLFLLLLATYLALETVRWLRPRAHRFIHTPLGEMIPELKVAGALLLTGLLLIVVGLPWAWRNDYQSLALALPLALWAGLLLLRRDQTPGQRFALLLVAAGVGLTAIAEVFTLKGDVGRMNVVFKSYLLVWIFFSIAAGAALVWVRARFGSDERRWLWYGVLVCLVIAAASYPVIGSLAKIGDRWPDVADPPRTLDGMAFMLGGAAAAPGAAESSGSAIYVEEGQELQLADDHGALRWMQANVPGTPTIVEGHTAEYRWGSRFAAYTGLPAVVGWSWHLRQHNAVLPGSVVENRISDVADFYNTESRQEAREFLERYGVDYVVVGDLERARYSVEGLAKFPQMVADGDLELVYPQAADSEGTLIYAVRSGQ